MKRASAVVFVVIILVAALGLASCGSGGNVTPPPPQRKVTGVTVTLGAQSIQIGATTSCTPTVTYSDNSTDHAATCSSSATGVASVANNIVTGVTANTANITATSTGSPVTTSAAVPITVTAAPSQNATITAVNPPIFACADEHLCKGPVVKLIGTNFTNACVETFLPPPAVGLSQYVSPTEIDLYITYDTPSWNPGPITVQACTQNAQTISNTFTIGMKTNRNMVAVDPTSGDVFLLDAASETVYHYKADGTLIGSWDNGANQYLAGRAMTFDDKTGYLAYVQGVGGGGIWVSDQNGNQVAGSSGNGQWGLDVAAKGGYAISIQPEINSLLGMNIASDPHINNPLTYTALNDPCALAMVQSGSTLDALVYNCGTNTVSIVSVPSMTLQGTFAPTGITSVGSGNTLVEVAGLSSGVGAVMSPVDKKLFLFNLGSGTAIGSPVALDGFPDGLTANEAADSFEVTYASTPQAVPTSAELVDAAGDKPIKLNLSSGTFPLGIGVSSDGKKLYVGDRAGTLDIQNNQ